jgi:TonB family protein
MQRRAAAQAAASAAQTAAQAHVKELETRIAQLEKEKSEAEARAAEDARKAIEQQAAAGGRAADPAAIASAQAEARQRARAEQERKQQEELARLAEARRAEELRLAAAAQAVLATPAPTPLASLAAGPQASTSTHPAASSGAGAPTSTQTGGGATVAAVDTTVPSPQPFMAGGSVGPAASANTAAGTPVSCLQAADPSDPAVRPPGLISEDAIPYPARAIARRIATVVVVRACVDETGRIAEPSIIQPSGQLPEYGFDQTALNRVKSRKYKPARRNDVPVPIWVVVRVEFRPQSR